MERACRAAARTQYFLDFKLLCQDQRVLALSILDALCYKCV